MRASLRGQWTVGAAAALAVAVTLVSACQPRDDGPPPAGPLPAEIVARGAYLVEGLFQCFYCHSERSWDLPGGPVAGVPGAGRVYWAEGDYRIVAPNLTPDPETGIGLRTDDELERAIRRGIGSNGRGLSANMPFSYFRHLSDADLAAVIAYLRSRDPVRNPLPETVLPPRIASEVAARPPEALDPMDLSSGDPAEVGRKLVLLARCRGCHTAWEAPRNPGVFAGGNIVDLGQRQAGVPDTGRPVFTTNLTDDASGVSYDAGTFNAYMRTGKGSTLDGGMPWTVFRNLDDADLRAIHAFLGTMHPVEHWVSNHDPPTYCPVCFQEHGLGSMNGPYEAPTGVPLGVTEPERYVGTYYTAVWDWRVQLSIDDGRLVARMADGRVVDAAEPPTPVVVLSRTRLLIPDEGVLDVAFGPDGAVTRLISVDVERDVMERVLP